MTVQSPESGTLPRFLNVHCIVSHAPSVMNRDDLGLHKETVFGGKRRLRLSSQCLKYAIRTHPLWVEHFGAPAIRTRQLGKLVDVASNEFAGRFSADLVRRAVAALSGAKTVNATTQAGSISTWSVREVADACEAIEGAGPTSDPKQDDAIVAAALVRTPEGRYSADVALGGRMALVGAMPGIDAALSLAHAITTHAVETEFDWFTALDDFGDDDRPSAGHLDRQNFGSGVFYKYAVIDLAQLGATLVADRVQALEYAAKFVELLAVAVPSAKQHSFAAPSPADYVAVSLGRIAVSGATAFERPVTRDRSGGYLAPSIEAFESYIARVHRGYDVASRVGVYSLWGASTLDAAFDTLAGLLAWLRSDPS